MVMLLTKESHSIIHVYFFRLGAFPVQNNPQTLDTSYKRNLNFGGCFGWKIMFYSRITVFDLFSAHFPISAQYDNV